MQSIVERNLSTPAQVSEHSVNLCIDGHRITVPAGTSVMRAAALADIKIPKLCATDQLEAFDSCRLCLVRIERKVTAVQATRVGQPSEWQKRFREFSETQENLLEGRNSR